MRQVDQLNTYNRKPMIAIPRAALGEYNLSSFNGSKAKLDICEARHKRLIHRKASKDDILEHTWSWDWHRPIPDDSVNEPLFTILQAQILYLGLLTGFFCSLYRKRP